MRRWKIVIKKWFSLLELIVAMSVFFILVTIVTSLFINLYKIKWSLEARQMVVKETYFLMEKLQTMMKDYTIDYEEYWNRQMVWCMAPHNPQWSGSSHCTMMTYYWNKNIIDMDAQQHKLYYCSSFSDFGMGVDDTVVWYADSDPADIEEYLNECQDNLSSSLGSNYTTSWFIQSYHQYQNLYTDVKDDVDYIAWPVNDDDDVDLWNARNAVYSDDDWVQELYLISHDKQRRIFIRRRLKDQEDINWDTVLSPSEKLYTLQILQLRWLDAWENHDFNIVTSDGVYDGVIDTRVCDYSMWFECGWQNMVGVYSGYRLPLDHEDWWKDLIGNDITITDRKVLVHPLKDPKLAWNDALSQQNPYVTVYINAQLYAKKWQRRLTLDQMNAYNLPIQTQFSFLQ